MKNIWKTLIILLITVVVLIALPLGFRVISNKLRVVNNKQEYTKNKIDEKTSYKLLKDVEDSARAMITSYESDKLKYIQYKDSEDKQEKSWGEQAKTRANDTAAKYNNYILKNSFVWEENVPDDIKNELPYIQ